MKTSPGMGTIIKQMRISRGLTLRELADKVGLSVSFLSKIERNISQPSFDNLQKICYALDITLNDLAPSGPKEPAAARHDALSNDAAALLTKSDQRTCLYNLNDIIRLESISALNPKYKLYVMTLAGDRAEHMSSKHRYDELGIVSKGKMAICLDGGSEHIMCEGDALYIPAGTGHTMRNLSDGECISYWLNLVFDQDDYEF